MYRKWCIVRDNCRNRDSHSTQDKRSATILSAFQEVLLYGKLTGECVGGEGMYYCGGYQCGEGIIHDTQNAGVVNLQ